MIPQARDNSVNENLNKTVTQTRFDGSKTVSTYLNGRVLHVENFNADNSAGNTLDYVYDGFNRQISVTEKFGSTVINTRETVYDAAGQPTSVTENGRATTYVYDSMGRKTQATLPGGRIVNYEYFTTGEPKKVYGAETYTQTLTWNDFGNKASFSTYRSGNTTDTTTWTYNNRNFMTAKTYADGKSIHYTYDADGRLLSRLWARGITTSYTYDNAGRQTAITYSDSTPGVTFAYDYLNRLTSVTDATGSRAFAYNADGTLASETLPYIVNNGTLEYAYDTLGRRTGLQLKQNNTAVYSNSYAYDVQGRIATVGDGTNTATYSRVPGTNLLNSTTISQGGVTKLTTSRTYDSLYRMTGISSASGTVTKAYNYTYDAKDRRTQLNMPDGSRWVYGYDDQGQIKSGVKYDAAGKAVPGQSFGYDYDGIGNLTSEQRNIAAMNIVYTANNVNQYTSRTIPGIAPVVGEADPTAAVKAIRTDIRDPAYADTMIVPVRDGKYFSGIFHNIANTAAAVNVTYDVYATKNDTANNQQLINKQSGSYLVAKSPQSFAYDNDGNTTNDGIWTYTWNGENRLIKMEKSGVTKLEFAYDYIGRRTEKKVYSWVNNAWSLASTEKYVYNGWNVIAVYDGNNALQKSYLWGIDLSGSLQGAGGVGGLLAENDNSTSYYPCYDGNGNVRAYVDNTGTSVADYEYGPFGQITPKSGSKADDFMFRFSTKYLDKETGLYYYGYRYYSPDLGRWISRDPMEEEGGKNLYLIVFNQPINGYDVLGLMPWYDIWLDKVTQFSAGASDALTFGVTNLTRGAIGWNETVKTDSGWYMSGEITELTVEVVVTFGGKALVSIASKTARKEVVGNAIKEFRVAKGYVGGEIHHWNPVKGHFGGKKARYPLPFEWAAKSSLNLTYTASRAEHVKLHQWMQKLERIDQFREKTMFARQLINRMIIAYGDKMKDVINNEGMDAEQKGICLDEPDFGIEVNIDAHQEETFGSNSIEE